MPNASWMLTWTAIHIASVILLAAAGIFVFSYHIFPLYFPDKAIPVAMPAAMSMFPLLAGVPAVAGIGLRMIIVLVVRKKPLTESLQKWLFDLLAFTQYLLIALLLLAFQSLSV